MPRTPGSRSWQARAGLYAGATSRTGAKLERGGPKGPGLAVDLRERAAAIRTHLDSVRNPLRSLSEKQYQALYGMKSLDFVLTFVPIEPAFMLAVTSDGNLFQEA